MSFVVMELKPAEVEYLNSMWCCSLCDHLMALHAHADESDLEEEHCEGCEAWGQDDPCTGVGGYVFNRACFIEGCKCGQEA